ncbi:glycosyl transferase family 39 [Pseudoroseomonas cervicalis]|uniref:glycosyl transferase family 39 n=1 Tax=Teichococcus cervicalis TaxID=204525 RepID=UPI0022F1A615|nr:glycosyl transferase family 39 [Pseudoroseomonas cervicalis]WBV41841.1 glycosyl transferase family 39 [Pseudoroseomonas cervicalis]
MFSSHSFRALTLAAGLAVALPGLALARDLAENANNGSTSSPSAYSMQVTQSREAAGIPDAVGNSAEADGNPLAANVSTTLRHEALHGARPVGNSANAFGGFGTGPVGG